MKWMRVVNSVLVMVVAGMAAWVGGCHANQSDGGALRSTAGNQSPPQVAPIGTTQNGELARFHVPPGLPPQQPGGLYPMELRLVVDGTEGTTLSQSPDLTLFGSRRALLEGASDWSRDGERWGGNRQRSPEPALGTIKGSSTWRPGEEIWVIAKRPPAPAARSDDEPGSGAMLCVLPGKPERVPAPLKHTSVRASIVGPAAKVDVTQTFQNRFSEKIEAVYVFPLPENGAVTEFVMTIGERRIRAVVREREEAERVYAAARSQGYTAALLTQERPNVFTQRVANIEPGRSIDVAITYYHTVAEMDGSYQWVFPMVVGPRFNPPSAQGEGIGAAARGDRGASGQRTEVQYLAPGERSGADIDVRVDVEAGVPMESVRCGSHAVRVQRVSGSRAVVELSRGDRLPNKDMVVEWSVSGAYAKGGLVYGSGRAGAADSAGDGSFVLMLVPPDNREKLQRSALEVVFVVDRSGSMDGPPIAQARAAVRRGLDRLRPGDSFQIIDFAESSSALGSGPLEATQENIRRGKAFVSGMDAKGGTYMLTGLRAALAFPHDPERLRFVVFLTDGLIGNETEVLSAQAEGLGDSRVFSFGVGSAPNRFLMDRMAKLGRGVAAYVPVNDSEEDGASTMDAFFDRIERPVLTDVTIDWNGARVSGVTPGRVPDLFTGRSVIVAGNVSGGFDRPVRVTGRVGGRSVTMEVQPTRAAGDGGRAVAAIRARQELSSLEERAIVEGWDVERYAGSVRRVALENGLVSPFTALVAVDSSVRTAGTSGVSVAVPVPVADGVRYDTTVGTGSGGDRGGTRDRTRD
ncbi:MAG TPA: VIT domain-containing protein [Phycisphaerales bacterium]|nr:VIT domain-containing protein [Phycisphaerales bacterium]